MGKRCALQVMGFKGFSDNPPFEQENIAGKSKLARWEFTFKDGKSQSPRNRIGRSEDSEAPRGTGARSRYAHTHPETF